MKIPSPFTVLLDIADIAILKAQFRRRAFAVPNLIVIWFDCSTAGKQLWFRRRARVEPNSGFSDAS